MKQIILSLAIAFFLVVPAWGQSSYPRWELPVGVSYDSADLGFGRENLFGFQTGFSVNFNRNVGLTVDWAGQGGSGDFTAGQFLIGPRFTKRSEKTTVFAHTLVGSYAFDDGGGAVTGLGLAFGGGLDVNTSDRIAIRIFQVDYIPNRISGQWFSDYRVGAGVVFKWGNR